MHEVSLVEALFDEAERAVRPHAPGDVRDVCVRIGALGGVDPELLRLAFEAGRAERGFGRATLEIRWEPAEWRCPACGAAPPAGEPLACPACGGPLALAAGGDLVLDRVTLEVPDV